MIYKYKTKRISPEDFENFQNPIDLFKDLRDGNINPKNDQINFKSDLGEITKGNKKSKIKDQINAMQNVEVFFDLIEKIIDFFRDYSLLLYKAK